MFSLQEHLRIGGYHVCNLVEVSDDAGLVTGPAIIPSLSSSKRWDGTIERMTLQPFAVENSIIALQSGHDIRAGIQAFRQIRPHVRQVHDEKPTDGEVTELGRTRDLHKTPSLVRVSWVNHSDKEHHHQGQKTSAQAD
jgi:hypothetical protein